MGQVNATNDMNATAIKLVGRGSRIIYRDDEGVSLSTRDGSVRPLVSPSRSQRVASIKTSLCHTANHGSARFPAQNSPGFHTRQTLRTSAVIREPRPTSISLRITFISFPAFTAFTAFHSGASPHQL